MGTETNIVGLKVAIVFRTAGGVGKHTTEKELRKCVNAGTKFINISPNASDAAKFLNAKQISIIPNTDTALMLSLAYILITSNNYDQKFIEEYTNGFNEFKSYVLGEKNNKPCTPEWASSITSIPEIDNNVEVYLGSFRTYHH